MENKILSVIYLLLVLILVIPGFLYANKNKKTLIKNFIIWCVIVFFIITFLTILTS